MPGIYKIQSLSHPDRVYIGSTVNLEARRRRHLAELLKKKHHCHKLQNHANKYGVDDLRFIVIAECPKEKLRVKEQCYINIFQPYFNECKYVCNLTEININGRSEEHKRKKALAQTGKNNSFFGKHHSEASKQAKRDWYLKHGIKPPGYHGGSKKGRIYKKKTAA